MNTYFFKRHHFRRISFGEMIISYTEELSKEFDFFELDRTRKYSREELNMIISKFKKTYQNKSVKEELIKKSNIFYENLINHSSESVPLSYTSYLSEEFAFFKLQVSKTYSQQHLKKIRNKFIKENHPDKFLSEEDFIEKCNIFQQNILVYFLS